MSELEQLKKRIDDSGREGIETSVIRDDYEPAGDMMIRTLVDSGEYVTRREKAGRFESSWRIFKVNNG